MALLEVRNINSGYGKKQVLYDVSFEVEQGAIVLLIGSNGSGKSTLLKVIYGLLRPWNQELKNLRQKEEGGIYFSGDDITRVSVSDLLERGLLYIPQQNNLFGDLTVRENLEIAGLTVSPKKILRERIDKALAIFPDLIPHMKRIPMKLSGGERQLLTLAMAILHQPKMILIDELFNGLSLQNITLARDNLRLLNEREGITFLIVEHRVKESYRMAQKIISLKLGKIFSVNELNSSFTLSDLDSVYV